MSHPLVSIITPAYNASMFIEDTIESVMNQDYSPIEHIIINDGSTDNTDDVISEYKTKYDLTYMSQNNKGQVPTLNSCIDLARGEFIIWINADDVLFFKHSISHIVNFFLENPDVDVVYGHMGIIDQDNVLLKIQYAIPNMDLSHFLAGHSAACICYRSAVLKGNRFDNKWDFVMDYEQCLRMASEGIKFGRLNEIIMGYRRHGATKSLSCRSNQLTETRDVKELYSAGVDNIYIAILSVLDAIEIQSMKFLGYRDIYRIYRNSCKSVAFKMQTAPSLKIILSQIIPYIY